MNVLTFSFRIHALIALLLGAACVSSLFAKSQPDSSAFVPSANHMSTLSWIDGPPVVHAYRSDDSYLYWFRPDEADLMLRSGSGALRFDPVQLAVENVSKEGQSRASQMAFQVHLEDGSRWQARLSQPVKRNYEFPIRINESGNWFHHVAVYGLELCAVQADGSLDDSRPVAIEGSLEWRAWGDCGSFEWHFTAPEQLNIQSVDLSWQVGESEALRSSVEAAGDDGWQLMLAYELKDGLPVQLDSNQSVVQVSIAAADGVVVVEPLTLSTEVQMAELVWPDSAGADYPKSDLERITRLPLELANPTAVDQEVRLRMIHPWHPVTGFVPMLLDEAGRQTGIPVQTSKNWHKKLGGQTDLPYDGQWVRTSTRVTVPAKSTLQLQYAIAHAQWQGLPAASVGQLSLVGWGGNGFWTQMALGSWGETFCFQPGRVLRRAMLTDIRATMQTGLGAGKHYAWTSNVGGGDVCMIKDAEGKYLAWVDAQSHYLAGGPNRAEVQVEEQLATGAASLKTNIILPRSNDFARTSLRIRFDVHKPFPFERFALLQMGTDYYSTAQADSVAYGFDGSEAKRVMLKPNGSDKEPCFEAELAGANAWFALVGDLPEANDRRGYGERGLIVREFKGRVGGQEISQPWLASYAVKDRAPNFNAEVGLAPNVGKFEAGDYIEALLEWVVIPPVADAYYGPNEGLRQQLSAQERGWALVPVAAQEGSGLQEYGYQEAIEGVALKHGSGLANLAVRECPSVGEWYERIDGALQPLGQRFSEEAKPQWAWDAQSGTWACFLSVRSPSQVDGVAERVFVLKP